MKMIILLALLSSVVGPALALGLLYFEGRLQSHGNYGAVALLGGGIVSVCVFWLKISRVASGKVVRNAAEPKTLVYVQTKARHHSDFLGCEVTVERTRRNFRH